MVSGQEWGVPHDTHVFGHGAINPQHFQKPLRVGAECGGGVGSKAHVRSADDSFPGNYSVDRRTRSESSWPCVEEGVMVRRAWRVE